MSEKHMRSRDYSDDYFDIKEWIVDPGQTPVRIDKFIFDRLERVSRNRVQNAVRAGAVTVDSEGVKPNFKVKPGHHVAIVIPRPEDEGGVHLVPENIPLDIRYEDEDVLVVYKPPGMVVHPGIGNRRGTLVNALAYHFRSLPIMEGNPSDRLGLVHRIDKNTSGLLVVAKNDYALTFLAKQFFRHTVERTYFALVWGEPEEDFGSIRANIGRHPRFRKLFTTFPDDEETGRWAVTHYKVLERLYYVSLVQCNLETGRTHQIRVHMQSLGHPLFNDDRYGGDHIVKGTIFSKYKLFVENLFSVMPRHGLHAKSLGFVHPGTGKWMQFDTELPEDFVDVLERWRTYLSGRKAALGKDLPE